MNKRNIVVATCSYVSIALTTWPHIANAGNPPESWPYAIEVDPVPATAATASGLNYSTGFEPGDGYPLGYISNTPGTYPAGCGGAAFPCWGHTTGAGFSLITPTIENLHPAGGLQHLRLTHDPTTRTNIPGFGLGIDARYPRTADISARPVAPNTVSVDIAISNPGGMNYRVQPQSNSQGLPATSVLFFYTGGMYILDDLCGTVGLNFQPVGLWDASGGFQNLTIAMDPCAPSTCGGTAGYGGPPPGGYVGIVNYYYGGNLIYTGLPFAGTDLEQFLVFGDNFPGSYMDVDNLVMSSLDQCTHTCGNGNVESWAEQCEPGNNPTGCNPGHTCGAVGATDECQCSRTCTLADPCDLTNGANGPFYGPFDATYGGIFIYDAPPGVDAVSVELCGSTGIDQRILYFGSCSDPGDPGSANDDCYPGYSGADPSASCYGTVTVPNYESCTCHDNPLPGDNCYLLQIRQPAGAGQVHIEVNKKAVCGEGHLGACCDTNGMDTGCTDNVPAGACVGADKVWTENGKCDTVTCACIPDCTGATCGDDGCGGSCGTCDDGNACNGVETCNANRTCDAGTPPSCNDGNACNGVETCNPSSGCVPGTPIHCDDGVACNGIETCNPNSGCVAGTPVNCDDGLDCTIDACNEPDGTCTHDDADCAIPTVSQWGLVVLTIMLLVAAKVRFARVLRMS